jgi:glycosyltransferase involved in cell wall biosynthesis
MGVLYFGTDISLPSVLWMRRMLAGLGDDVARLVTEVEPGAEYRKRYPVTVLGETRGPILHRALRRLGLVERVPPPASAEHALETALQAPEVTVSLIHYLTAAVRYGAILRRVDKPIFVHCHGWDVTWDLHDHEPPYPREHPRSYPEEVRALPSRVSFIANSETTARRLQAIGIGDDRIKIKYLGVPVPAAEPTPHRPGEVEILYLGRLVDCKGPDLVIRAFDLACDQGLDGRLVIAGDGPLYAECSRLREASSHAERISLPGAVDGDTGEELRRRAAIFTAHNQLGPRSLQEEAFGVAIVEAMAAGLPVVSGRNGSLPELVDDGVHGLLVEPGDVEAHAEAFLRLAADPELRTRMGRAGWRRAGERFTLEREMAALRRILGLGAVDGDELAAAVSGRSPG